MTHFLAFFISYGGGKGKDSDNVKLFVDWYHRRGTEMFFLTSKTWSSGPVEDPAAGGQGSLALPVTVSRRDGVLEYWSDGLSIMNSMHQRISVASA
jgi:hypothetical protein